jgi:hypothetical protein
MLQSITVTGEATCCNAVMVSINCTGPGLAKHQPVPVIGGQWQTTFSDQEIKIAGCTKCEDLNYPITVKAECTNPTVPPTVPGQVCSAPDQVLMKIPCVSCCPTVSVQATVGDCDPQGLRNVTFQVTTTSEPNCPPIFAQLDFGDGTMGNAFTVPPSQIWTESHAYLPGFYTAKVRIIYPAGCEDIPITVGPLQECPCPTVTLADPAVKGCIDSNSTATVNVTATVSPAVAGCLLKWQFDDGYHIQTQIPNNGNNFSNTQSHEYSSAGSHSVSVTAICGICSESATKGFDVQECGSDGGGGGGCKNWLDPRCWGSLCGALLAAAMIALAVSGALFIYAGCTAQGDTPGAILGFILASALFSAAIVFLVLSVALFVIWFLICSKLPNYDFCGTLHHVISTIRWITIIQFWLAVAMISAGQIGCFMGLILSWGSWSAVLEHLEQFDDAVC